MTWVFRDRDAWVFGENVLGGPQITTATGTFSPGDTVTINGTGLDAVTSVLLGSEAQTVATQSATQITFTAVRGGLKYGSRALDVSDGSTTDRVFVSMVPESGWGYIDVAGLPWPLGQYSVLQDAVSAAANGDQIHYRLTTDQGGNVTMNPDGTFEIDAVGIHSFPVEAWDATDSTWSDSVSLLQVNAGTVTKVMSRAILAIETTTIARAIVSSSPIGTREISRKILASLSRNIGIARRVGSQWRPVTY